MDTKHLAAPDVAADHQDSHAAHPGSPTASKRVSFSDPLVSSPSHQEQPRNHFSPTLQRGFSMPRSGSSFAASTKAVLAVLAETAYEDRPLTLSTLLPRPVLGGEPCGGCLQPAPLVHGQTRMASTLYSSAIVYCVQSLYISRYVYNNKPVLSYPMPHYLLVHSIQINTSQQSQRGIHL